jgi:hypothetical protein
MEIITKNIIAKCVVCGDDVIKPTSHIGDDYYCDDDLGKQKERLNNKLQKEHLKNIKKIFPPL